GDVLKLIIKYGMKLTLIGVLIGLAGALALTRLVKTLLFDVGATDPLTFSSIVALLALVAVLACILPARRGAKGDPFGGLHQEEGVCSSFIVPPSGSGHRLSSLTA